MSLEDKKSKLFEQLDALKIFPNNKLVRELRRQIQDKIARIEKDAIPVKKKITETANKTRSGKLRRYHSYIRQIRNNFPEYSYKQIREQFAKRRNQEDVSIPDAVWQNPSP
ncbi:MAG: hypothetical protein OEW49_04725 [Nitrosopumilus sp.]|nr:hypothetical protein [Nitrosopumilus sp.]